MALVSIIIPAWNEAKALKSALRGLLGIHYDKKQCEIVLVAGGDDGTYDIAQEAKRDMNCFARCIVIAQHPQGKNAAIQEGLKQAEGKIIVLLDADTVVSRYWLRNMVNAIDQGRCDLAISNPEPIVKSWVSEYYMIIKACFINSITTYSGNAMAFRASTVENRLDYFFDRATRVGVDYLLARRFHERGLRTMFVRNAHVMTHIPSSLKFFVLTEFRWLTALIRIDGVNYKTLSLNAAVIVAMMLLIPLSKILFWLAVLFHITYVTKRTRMFFIASREYSTSISCLPGFILLSYIYHIIGFICYVTHVVGLSKKSYLYQGERY